MPCLVTRLVLPRVVEKFYQLWKSLLVGFLGDPALGDPACAEKRVSNHNVPPGSSENPYGEARSAEFDGTGWTGGTDGHQKCPLIFFQICEN